MQLRIDCCAIERFGQIIHGGHAIDIPCRGPPAPGISGSLASRKRAQNLSDMRKQRTRAQLGSL